MWFLIKLLYLELMKNCHMFTLWLPSLPLWRGWDVNAVLRAPTLDCELVADTSYAAIQNICEPLDKALLKLV